MLYSSQESHLNLATLFDTLGPLNLNKWHYSHRVSRLSYGMQRTSISFSGYCISLCFRYWFCWRNLVSFPSWKHHLHCICPLRDKSRDGDPHMQVPSLLLNENRYGELNLKSERRYLHVNSYYYVKFFHEKSIYMKIVDFRYEKWSYGKF